MILFLTIVTQPVWATVIHGKNEEYAGREIEFYSHADPVSQEKEFVFLLEFDNKGNFHTNPEIKNIGFVFCEFGIYKGLFFLEPDKEIELKFPPLREKSFADEKNPFFEPVTFWFETVEGNRLTDQVARFDRKFNELTDHFFNYLYFRQSKEVFDSVSTVLDREMPQNSPEVLQVHKKMKLKLLETDVFRLKTEDVSGTISYVPVQFWNHPAFIAFFEKIFSNKLSLEAKTTKGLPVRKAVANGDINFLFDLAQRKYELKGQAVELVVLKLLHDGFYSGEFSQEPILKMLKSAKLKGNQSQIIRNIANNTIEKLEFLMPGTKAPVICLKNIDGYRVCSDQDSGKFKYLLFADTEMIVCHEHLKYLSEIQDKFRKYLEIIIVLRKTDLIEMKMFLDKQQIPGLKLVDNEGEYIDRYRIQSFPEAFLLNKDHEVVFVHTKTPLDGFEQQFGAFLQNELFMQQRNQSR
jgi:hypothetical protein